MASSRPHRVNPHESEEISRALLRKIGTLQPYADADPRAVEERLRNMNYGATNSRVSKLRRDAVDTEPAGE